MSYTNHQNYGHPWPPDPSAPRSPAAHDSGSYQHQQHRPNFPPPPPHPMYVPNPPNFYPGPLIPNFANAVGPFPPHPPPLPFPNAMPSPYHHYGAPPIPPLGFPPFQPIPHPQARSAEASGTSTPNATVNIPQQSHVESEVEEAGDKEEGELEEEMSMNDDDDHQSQPKSTDNNELDVEPYTRLHRHQESFSKAHGPAEEQSGAPATQTGRSINLHGAADDLLLKTVRSSSIRTRNTGSGAYMASSHSHPELPPSPTAASQHSQPTKVLSSRPAESIDANANETETTAGSALNGKSLSQLRKLAQGALLNLAPHNIRFQELVDEGVDPAVLKALYDEIGIKVYFDDTGDKQDSQQVLAAELERVRRAASSNSAFSSVGSTGSVTENAPAILGREAPAAIQPRPADSAARHAPGPENASTGSAPPATAPGKPLERKDLIARMLALKAGKSTTSDLSSQAKEQSQPPVTASSSIGGSPDSDRVSPSPRSETRVKEINRAQTELAKQRMEQLKKEGLRLSQARASGDSAILSLSASVDSNSNSSQTATPQGAPTGSLASSLRHPLPDRPPGLSEGSVQIPGLFMTGSDSLGTQQQSTAIEEQPTAKPQRKRPRASDFTDDDDAIEVAYKRFSPQGRRLTGMEHRVVIDISEDESMYDSDASDRAGNDNTRFRAGVPQSASTLPLRNHPPLSDLPSAGGYSNISTPSSLPQSPRKPEHLQMEILNLRQQIAERERRRNEKLAAIQAQAASAPSTSGLSSQGELSATGLDRDRSLHEPAAASGKLSTAPSAMIGSMNQATTTPAFKSAGSGNVPSSPLSQARSSLGPRHVEEIRQKLMRKQEIESGLPLLEDELLKTEAKLAQCREEEKKLLAEIAKGREGRLRLVEELQALGIETDGLTMEELQQAKDSFESSVAANDETGSTVGHESQAPVEASARPLSEASDRSGLHRPSAPLSIPELAAAETATIPKDTSRIDPGEDSVDMITDERSETHEVDRLSCSSSAMDESMGSDSESVQEISEDGALADSGNLPTSSAQITPQMALSEASASGGDDGAGELDPAEEASSGSQFYDANGEDRMSRKSSIVSETYEPPEPPAKPNPVYSPEFSPAPPETADQMDIEIPTGPRSPSVEAPISEDAGIAPAADVDMTEEEDQGPSYHYFTPYESPLSRFRAYRYHPHFTDSVKGGFRSLTYSHKINPHNPICEYEASGGVCNDRSCKNQHFRDISLSDDKILVEMGSLREGKTPKEQEEYVAGLRQIITDMRRDKVKDFTTVATEIAAYRRRFLQDPSRVLAM